MRTARVCPPLAAILLLFVVFCITSSQAQTYLVCKRPNTHDCITWQMAAGVSGNSLDNLPSAVSADYICGFTSYNPRKIHRKFLTIESLYNGLKKSIFCKGITEVDGVFDWWQIQDLSSSPRVRRDATFVPRGKYRGQTQSQYLAIDRGTGKDEGKAEAQSAADSSRASVSGNSGMGQAQSQSIYDPSCDDCYGKPEQNAESLRRRPDGTNGYGGPNWPGHGPGYSTQYSGGPGYPSHSSDSSYGPAQSGLTGQDGKPYGNTYAPNSRFIPGASNGPGPSGRYGPGVSGTGYGPGTYGTGTYSPHSTGEVNPNARENIGQPGRTGSNGSGYGNGPYPATGLASKPGEVPISSTGSSDDNVNPRHHSGTGYGLGQPGYIPDQGASMQDLNNRYSPVDRNSGNYSPGKPIAGTIYPTQDGSYGPDGRTNGMYKPGQNSFIPGQSNTNGNNAPNGINNGYRPPNAHNGESYYGPSQRGPSGSNFPGQGAGKSYEPNGDLLPPGQLSAPENDKFIPGSSLQDVNGHTPVQNNGVGTPGQSPQSIVKYNQNGSPTATYTPGQTGSFFPGQGNQANWPLASGPFLGPDGLNYICCVVPGQTGPGTTYSQNIPRNVGGPNNLLAPGTQFGHGGVIPSGQNGIDSGTGGVGPSGKFGPSGEILGTKGPNGQYIPGDGMVGTGQYNPGNEPSTWRQFGQDGRPVTERKFSPGGENIGGQSSIPYGSGSGPRAGMGGSYGNNGPGEISRTSVGGPGGQYVPGSGVNGPVGQYVPNSGSGTGVGGPGGQYIPGSGTGSGAGGPGGQYISGSGTGSGLVGPGGHNIPGSGNGSGVGEPGRQYLPGSGISSGEGGPGGQYVPGSGVGGPVEQYVPNSGTGTGVGGRVGQYVPNSGTGTGVGGPVGQYVPNSGTGTGVGGPGGQYIPSSGTGSGVGGPGGQYIPSSGTGSGVGGPGGQYIPGSGNGSGVGKPGGQYIPSSEGGGGPRVQYGPGIDSSSGATQPGRYIPGGGSRAGGPGEQYRPGDGTSFREGGPRRQFDLGGAPNSGVGIPGAQYGPERGITSGTSRPEGQYRPGGETNRNDFGAGEPGQYIPVGGNGSGTSGPGGQFVPGSGTDSRISGPGRFIPGSESGSEARGPGLQYGPGRGTGFGISGPDGRYIPGGGTNPGLGGLGGQYTPGIGTGSGVGGPEGQYGPERGTNSGGGGPNGQYIPGGRFDTGIGGPEDQKSPSVGNDYGKGGPNSGMGTSGRFGPGSGAGVGISPEGVPSNQNNPYGDAGSNGGESTRRYPYDQSGTQYGGGGQNNGYNGVPQNYVDPNSITDPDDSQAEALVSQAANGTTASAASKGGNDKGRAQTHVQGTYTGSGTFQAQAQIAGENKEAESAVSGGKKGASSSATGSGRNNKSQASVQLGSETGAVQTNSQSSGAMHSSNSQVQGSVKGGMADAQARGPGSTSSQAQIGFTPYKDSDKAKHDLQKAPFVGGGIASAQSSGRTGQSQSQLHGTFKYGIRYNGAAQAGASLDKDAVFPNRLSFDKMDVFDDKDKNINVDLTESPPETETEKISNTNATLPEFAVEEQKEEDLTTTEKTFEEVLKNSESKYDIHPHADHHKYDTSPSEPTLTDNKRSFHNVYNNNGAEYEYTTDKDENDDYDSEGAFIPEGPEGDQGAEYSNYDEYPRGEAQTHQSLQNPSRKGLEVRQTTGGNTQHIVLGSLKKHDAEITQKSSERPDEKRVYQPGERVPGTGGYTIPIGFTGSVKSVASKDKTYVVGSRDSPSQAQTVSLTPGTGKVRYAYPSSYGKYVHPTKLRSLHSKGDDDNRYVSVSKSVTRALDDDNNIRKQYSHTYYTKSSSCGYFTFTCTMVSSAEGKKKVCKPKIPTNPDGTPIRC